MSLKIFEAGEIHIIEGRKFRNLVAGNQFTPDIWQQGWEEIIEPEPESPRPLTFQQIQARHFAAEALGVPFEISPEDSYVLSREANLPSIPDGQEWRPGLNLAAGTIVKHNGKSFMVREGKGHISQADWAPDLVPALFEKIRKAYADWAQPMGAHDAYMTGDRVMHDGRKWESTVDNNVWPPGVFGWREITQ